MHRGWKALLSLTLLPALVGCSLARPATPAPPVVRVDTSAAVALLDLVEASAQGHPWGRDRIRALVASEPYRVLLAHHGHLDSKVTADRLTEVLATLASEETLSVRVGRLARMQAAYRAARDRLPELRSRLQALSDPALVERAAVQAQEFLPRRARLQATVYVVGDGYSPAYAIEDAVVVDLLQASRPERVEGWLAHELHHIGVAALLPQACSDPPLGTALDVLAGLLQEGAATYWIEGWRAQPAKEAYEEVRAFLLGVLQERLSPSETEAGLAALLGEGRGPLYQVGNAMIARLVAARGDAWVRERLGDPVGLLQAYSKMGGWAGVDEILALLDKNRSRCPAWFGK